MPGRTPQQTLSLFRVAGGAFLRGTRGAPVAVHMDEVRGYADKLKSVPLTGQVDMSNAEAARAAELAAQVVGAALRRGVFAARERWFRRTEPDR